MDKKFAFKNTQSIGWDSEPADARPSEFMPSTNFATLSGFHPLADAAPRQHRRGGFELTAVIGFVIFLAACGVAAINWLPTLLRA